MGLFGRGFQNLTPEVNRMASHPVGLHLTSTRVHSRTCRHCWLKLPPRLLVCHTVSLSTHLSLCLTLFFCLSIYLSCSPLHQIFNLMKFDSYSRFLKSWLYQECLRAEVDGRPLPDPYQIPCSPAPSKHSASSDRSTLSTPKKVPKLNLCFCECLKWL